MLTTHDLHFSHMEQTNKLIDKFFATKIELLNSMPPSEAKGDLWYAVRRESAHITSFITLWFIYTNLEEAEAVAAVDAYLSGVSELPVDTIDAHFRVIWEKMHDPAKIQTIMDKWKTEAAMLGGCYV